MMSPDAALVWSDLLLGIVTLIFAFLTYFRSRRATPIFFFASASALSGGVYHHIAHTVPALTNNILWLLVELLLATSAIYLIYFALDRPLQALSLCLILAVCGAFFSFVSQDFTWVALLQVSAACCYGIALIVKQAPSASRVNFVLYVASTILSAWLTIPASLNNTDQRLTGFHLMEVAAVLFLYLSILNFPNKGRKNARHR